MMRTHEQILIELQQNAEEFRRVAHAAPESAIARRPDESTWSVKEILCHLSDIQRLGVTRIEKMLAHDNPPVELYDEQEENRTRDHSHDNLERAVEDFEGERASLIQKLKGMDESGWQRTGQHPQQERFTIEFILNDMLDHERAHFEQVRQRIDGRLV